jgi:hypothetical protein
MKSIVYYVYTLQLHLNTLIIGNRRSNSVVVPGGRIQAIVLKE